VAADADASAKSFSAVFCASVSLSRFASRSASSAGPALLLQIDEIIRVSSHEFWANAGAAPAAVMARKSRIAERI
jgi:hypothetical protein